MPARSATIAKEIGLRIRWRGKGAEEVGTVESRTAKAESLGSLPAVGQVIVRIDPRYFRPTDVESLLGDATKAKVRLGWSPKITFDALVSEMMQSDLTLAQKDRHARQGGFKVLSPKE